MFKYVQDKKYERFAKFKRGNRKIEEFSFYKCCWYLEKKEIEYYYKFGELN
jgi:hypothetical protein